jgi:hypothetical protein
LNGGTADHSLDSDGSCLGGSGANPLLQDSLLAPVFAGGTTQTYPLATGSPALGAGDQANCPPSDQRGSPAGVPCDLGSYQSGGGAPSNPMQPPATSSTTSTPTPAQSTPGTSGPPSGSTALSVTGVVGRGTLAGGRHSLITFSIRLAAGKRTGTFDYTDSSRHLHLRAASIGSLVIDEATATATVSGVAVNVSTDRRVRFTLVVDCAAGSRSVSLRLASGYSHRGALLRGSVSLTAP